MIMKIVILILVVLCEATTVDLKGVSEDCVDSTMMEINTHYLAIPCVPQQNYMSDNSITVKGKLTYKWILPKKLGTDEITYSSQGNAIIKQVNPNANGPATCMLLNGNKKKIFHHHLLVFDKPRYRFDAKFGFEMEKCSMNDRDVQAKVKLIRDVACPAAANCERSISGTCYNSELLQISVTGKEFPLVNGKQCRGNVDCSTNLVIAKATNNMEFFLRELKEAKMTNSGSNRLKFNKKMTTASVGIVCSVGYFYHKEKKLCIPCEPGSFLGEGNRECLPCPAGSYQDEYGKAQCKSCQTESGRKAIGAKNKADCNVAVVTPNNKVKGCEYKQNRILQILKPPSPKPQQIPPSNYPMENENTNINEKESVISGVKGSRSQEINLDDIKQHLAQKSLDLKDMFDKYQTRNRYSSERLNELKWQYLQVKNKVKEISVMIRHIDTTKYNPVHDHLVTKVDKSFHNVLRDINEMMGSLSDDPDNASTYDDQPTADPNVDHNTSGNIDFEETNISKRSEESAENANPPLVLADVGTAEERLRVITFAKAMDKLDSVNKKYKHVRSRAEEAKYLPKDAKMVFLSDVEQMKDNIDSLKNELTQLKTSTSDLGYATVLKLTKAFDKISQSLDEIDSKIVAYNIPKETTAKHLTTPVYKEKHIVQTQTSTSSKSTITSTAQKSSKDGSTKKENHVGSEVHTSSVHTENDEEIETDESGSYGVIEYKPPVASHVDHKKLTGRKENGDGRYTKISQYKSGPKSMSNTGHHTSGNRDKANYRTNAAALEQHGNKELKTQNDAALAKQKAEEIRKKKEQKKTVLIISVSCAVGALLLIGIVFAIICITKQPKNDNVEDIKPTASTQQYPPPRPVYMEQNIPSYAMYPGAYRNQSFQSAASFVNETRTPSYAKPARVHGSAVYGQQM